MAGVGRRGGPFIVLFIANWEPYGTKVLSNNAMYIKIITSTKFARTFWLRDTDFTVSCLSDITLQFILVMLYQHSGLQTDCSLYHSHITNLTKRCHLLLEKKNRAQFLPFKTKHIFNYQIKIRRRLLFLAHLTGTNSIIISFTYNKKTINKYVARKKKH